MLRLRTGLTLALMALSVSTPLARQTAAGATVQGSQSPPPKVTFSDKDRKAIQTWFDANQKNPPAGLKAGDRPSSPVEAKFKQGLVLDSALRDLIHPVPTDLLHMLAPPPGVYRYAIVDWHFVLIDDSYRIFDVIHIGHVR